MDVPCLGVRTVGRGREESGEVLTGRQNLLDGGVLSSWREGFRP